MSKNEKHFLSLFKNNSVISRENRTINVHKDTIKTSVDFKIDYDGTLYLIEIDSYNMCKCILGQYVLINHSERNYDHTKTVFVSIHYYKKYNIERTENHIQFARNKLGCKIPFAVFHINDFKKKEFYKIEDFIRMIKTKID